MVQGIVVSMSPYVISHERHGILIYHQICCALNSLSKQQSDIKAPITGTL